MAALLYGIEGAKMERKYYKYQENHIYYLSGSYDISQDY